ncbi:hypothetical protein [Dickeya dadantii]|nr:hypothetical protein [Dickeya dadantii]
MEATLFLCHGRLPFLVIACPPFDEIEHFADGDTMSSEKTVPK